MRKNNLRQRQTDRQTDREALFCAARKDRNKVSKEWSKHAEQFVKCLKCSRSPIPCQLVCLSVSPFAETCRVGKEKKRCQRRREWVMEVDKGRGWGGGVKRLSLLWNNRGVEEAS